MPHAFVQPAAPARDLFGAQAQARPQMPPQSLLDLPSPPLSPKDPYGLVGATDVPAGALGAMSPLAAALPAIAPPPPMSPTGKAKLGSAVKKPADPFATLIDL